MRNELINFDFALVHVFYQGDKLFLTKNTCNLIQGKGSVFEKYYFFPVSLISDNNHILSHFEGTVNFETLVNIKAHKFFAKRSIAEWPKDVFITAGCYPAQSKINTKRIWLWCFHEIIKDDFDFLDKTKSIEAKDLYKHLVMWMVDNFMTNDVRLLLAEKLKTIQSTGTILSPIEKWEVQLFGVNDIKIQCSKCQQGLFVKSYNAFICTSCSTPLMVPGIKWQLVNIK